MIPSHTRVVGVKEVSFPLTRNEIKRNLLGKEVYRRTRYLILHGKGGYALARVAKRDTDTLFRRISRVEVLSLPDETAWVESPEADVWNLGGVAEIAAEQKARCTIVKGLYQYVNFALDENPLQIHVYDTIPPEPPRLVEYARKAAAHIKAPVILKTIVVDTRRFAEDLKSDEVVFQCHIPGTLSRKKRTYFLNETPRIHEGNVGLVGCEMSKRIFDHIYSFKPEFRDTCPKNIFDPRDTPSIMRCCLQEKEVVKNGNVVVVPWGFSFENVVKAMNLLLAEHQRQKEKPVEKREILAVVKR